MLTDKGIFTTAILLTAIVALESKLVLWSPYFLIYAVLAILIPLALRICRFGSLKSTFKKRYRVIAIVFVLSALWSCGLDLFLSYALEKLRLVDISYYSLQAAINLLAQETALKFGISPAAAMSVYAFFTLVWAPIGESLFYLGYIQEALRREHSFTFAALASASFFGLRHGTHFLFLLPDYPLIAGLTWIISAFVFGLLMSYLYEKTSSLYPPIAVHFAANVISIATSA